MEQTMFDAIMKMKATGEINALVCQTREQKFLWKTRLSFFTLSSTGELLWNGLKVPTTEELTLVLWPFHETEKKHVLDEKVLRKVLSDKGYALPTFIGGLERAVKV